MWVADFETTTKENDCRVWYWATCELDNPDKIKRGTDIMSFMQWAFEDEKIIYFHNLKFDGMFIMDFLLRRGFQYSSDKKYMKSGYFNSLISDMGQWYTFTVHGYPNKWGIDARVEFRDSLKIIPMSVEEIPKSFGLEESKGEIDYNKERPIGYQPTKEEQDYIDHDVIIVAKALKFMIDHNMKKLTNGSCALEDCKNGIGKKQFKRLFPSLDLSVDKDIRMSYKGGWTYLNPKYKDKDIGEGTVFDVNSMYPWAMMYCSLPFGEPVYFSGKYNEDNIYPLYVQQLVCEFKLKKGHYPSIQIKGSSMYGENEYIEYSLEPTLLTLTNVDLELLFFNYDVEVWEYIGGYMFRSQVGMFEEYINRWYEVKRQSKKEGNKGLEKIAKLMLNSLYGKFGSKRIGKSKIPYFSEEDNCVKFMISEPEERKGGYLPVATFITSYCRDRINRGAYACGDRFIYADTDSLHVKGKGIPDGLDVDEYRLGAFKVEEEFIRGKFLRQKTYLEILLEKNEEKINLKCCGMPRKMQETVTEEDFFIGAVFDASVSEKFSPKLMPRVVPGGVILRETTFKIKE